MEDAPAAFHQALDEREAPSVARINEPIRRLETSIGCRVYLTEHGRAWLSDRLSARASSGAVEMSHSFQDSTLTSHPAEASESQQTLPHASGQRSYLLPTSSASWYGLRFTYAMPKPGRTLAMQVCDNAGKALRMAWSDLVY